VTPSHEAGRARIAIDLAINPTDLDAATLLAAAMAGEDAGFDGVWVYDHLSGAVLGGSSSHDVWSMLAAIAVRTTRVTLGPFVVNAVARHPAHVAVAAATLQDLSGGRAILGLGAAAGPESSFSRELAMLGLPVLDAATRRGRVADTIGYLRALWDGEPSYKSESAHFDAVAGVGVPSPQMPILVGANGPRMAALGGELADGVNFHSWETDLPGLVAAVDEAARRAGRSTPELSVEGPFEPVWLDRAGAEHDRMRALGVTRVMVRWNASLRLDDIAAAARVIAAA
jgi:alkanesulfonate monooxygenase SsuD/methylene tetrahydromethanopterin reductase-like flavin-dependent oxidoreductase (luciferase family)